MTSTTRSTKKQRTSCDIDGDGNQYASMIYRRKDYRCTSSSKEDIWGKHTL